MEGVKELLKTGIDVNATDEHGNTALHFVASTNYTDIAQLLLKAGENPNATNIEGSTPLHNAAKSGRVITHF